MDDSISALLSILSTMTDDQKEALKNALETGTTNKKPVKRPTKQLTNFQLGPRPNDFATSELVNEHKEDTEIDKLLWADKKPSARGRRNTKVESECSFCEKIEEVNGIFASFDEDDKKYYHQCQKCLRGKKK